MIVQDILNSAFALMQETQPQDNPTVIPLINNILAETFDINNGIRAFANKEKLPAVPVVSSLTDELPYEDTLVAYAFPYGLATRLLFDDSDMNKMAYMLSQFNTAVSCCRKVNVTQITDLYGGDE